MNNNLPFVSVVIPCRNEEKFIAKCLDLLMLQDYPEQRMEIIVIDGMSIDKTREIIVDYCKKFLFIKLLDNSKKFTPFAMNIGIKNAKGDFIIFMGAHAEYALDYVSRCVTAAEKSNADNVGGIAKISSCQGLPAKAIAGVLSSPFGAGDARYKTLLPKEPIETDTVFGGCYKKEVFSKIGLFDERMIRSQDLELNLRLKKAGGKILLVPGIVSYYYPRADLIYFARHNFDDGFWVIYPLKFKVRAFMWRHLIPLIFVVSLFLSLMVGFLIQSLFWLPFLALIVGYLSLSLVFSAQIALKERSTILFLTMLFVFFIRHFFFGLGSLWALVKLPICDKK
jgi:glycosyltransferase involved in cell wall biosynthesis